MTVRRRAVPSIAFIVACVATVASAAASAQDFAGNYRITSDVTTAEVPEWGSDCGQRPENHRGNTGRQVRVSADGTNLVIEDRPRMRTDGCWSQNPRTRRVSTSGGNGRWTTQCTSPAEDYQHEDGTYSTTAEPTRITLRDRTVYRWTLQGSSCRANIMRTMVYERIDAPTPAPVDSGVAPTPTPPRDSGVRPARCALPGPAARIAIITGRRSTTPGSRVCFRAQVVDADGCPAINATSSVITWNITRRNGGDPPSGEGGCVTVASNVTAGTEFTVVASATAGFEERVTLRVVTPEESNSLVAQLIEDEDAGTSGEDAAAAPRIDEGFGAVSQAPTAAPTANHSGRNALVAGLTAVAVLLAGAAFFLLRKKKPAPEGTVITVSEPPLEPKGTAAQGSSATDSDGARGSLAPGAPRVRKDEVPIPMGQMPIAGLPPVAAGAKKSAPANLAQTMIGAMPNGTDQVLENAPPTRQSASSMPAVTPAIAAASAAPEASAKPKRCPICNQRFALENAFCPEHGAALVLADAPKPGSVIVDPIAAVAPTPTPAPAPAQQAQGSFRKDPLARTHIAGSAATTTENLRCPVCGRTYGPGNVFCGDDGSRLEGA
jgi:hypothetical protein